MGEGYSTHEYDVLVIGAGGAGLRAAIEASSSGATVAIISKSMLGKAHTVMACLLYTSPSPRDFG